MKTKNMKLIWEYLSKCENGNTIDNMMDALKLARGTIKPNLFYLMLSDNVVEYVYSQNTKIYKIKHREFVDNEFINSVKIE